MDFWTVLLVFLAFSPIAVWGMVGQLDLYYPSKEQRLSARKSRNIFTKVYIGYWYQAQAILIVPICYFAARAFTANTEHTKFFNLSIWLAFVVLYLPFAFAFFFPNSKR